MGSVADEESLECRLGPFSTDVNPLTSTTTSPSDPLSPKRFIFESLRFNAAWQRLPNPACRPFRKLEGLEINLILVYSCLNQRARRTERTLQNHPTRIAAHLRLRTRRRQPRYIIDHRGRYLSKTYG